MRGADIISCATLAHEPLIRGAWLPPGVHLDLVGGFTPDMREADDEAVQRARVFVDTRAGACKEAGDIVQPLRAGDHRRGRHRRRPLRADPRHARRAALPRQITLFKSVGTALEDLAAAQLAFERARG